LGQAAHATVCRVFDSTKTTESLYRLFIESLSPGNARE
jgi:hypothetical protein